MARKSHLNQENTYAELRERIAYNATLLHSLNEVPGNQDEFDLVEQDKRYQLPIEREKQLSEDFAFLAASTGKASNVVAVAIEEDPDKQGMTIRIAANRGDLTSQRFGLVAIACVLQRAAARVDSRAQLQPCLLNKIIELCLSRILSRLRSKHIRSRKPGSPSIVCSLNNHVHTIPSASLANENISLETLQKQSRLLKDRFDRLETMKPKQVRGQPGHLLIAEMLHQMKMLVETLDIANFLQQSKTVDPTLIQSLPLSMSKLARYYLLSHSLLDAARNHSYTIFRMIRVETSNAVDFLSAPVLRQHFSFDQVLHWHSKAPDTAQITKARQRPWVLDQKTKAWKVHAEIQLLFFYHSRSIVSRPRLLSASKSACYLCCLFVRSHGKFEVPRTHGRLYKSWTLPDVPGGSDCTDWTVVTRQFNRCLEDQIRLSLANEYKAAPHPSESVTAFHKPWTPASTVVIGRADSVNRAATPTICQESLTSKDLSLQSAIPLSATDQQGSYDSDSEAERQSSFELDCTDGDDDLPVIPEDDPRSNLSNESGPIEVCKTWRCYRVSTNSTMSWFHHCGMELFLQHDYNEHAATRDCWIGLKYIDKCEAQISDSHKVLDLPILSWNGVDSGPGSASSSEPLVISWFESVIVVKFEFDAAPEDPRPFLQKTFEDMQS